MTTPFANVAATIRRIVANVRNPLEDTERRNLIAVAIGRACAAYFPLPSSPVASVAVHFTMTFDDPLNRILNAFNEELVIDIRTARDTAFKFYQLRYDLVHTPMAFESTLPIIAAALPDYFSDTVRQTLAKEAVRIGAAKETGEYYQQWGMLVLQVTNSIRNDIANSTALPTDIVQPG